jgi:hypothetical protein
MRLQYDHGRWKTICDRHDGGEGDGTGGRQNRPGGQITLRDRAARRLVLSAATAENLVRAKTDLHSRLNSIASVTLRCVNNLLSVLQKI